MHLSRRAFLGSVALAAAGPTTLAAAPADGRRLVVVILRGGMDGLHAVPPVGDPSYAPARGALTLGREGTSTLDATFALHPALASLLPLWNAKELGIVHAVASPYRERSHFDGQDVLETGAVKAHALADGWLNRALGGHSAMAVGQSLPLLLRGPAKATSWAPSPLPGLPPAQVQALAALYAGDPLLSGAFEDGIQMEAFAADALADSPDMAGEAKKKSNAFPSLAAATGHLMASPDGPRVVVMELGGWDTHTAQTNRMALPLSQLAEGIAALAAALGPAWSKTVLIAASEFGRTVAVNGTGGTDHGTAGAMILAGGALAGGKVVTDWPGLDKNQLHQGRDLRPTLDGRAVFKGVLRDHLGISGTALDGTVFPDSGGVKALSGLVRANTEAR